MLKYNFGILVLDMNIFILFYFVEFVFIQLFHINRYLKFHFIFRLTLY